MAGIWGQPGVIEVASGTGINQAGPEVKDDSVMVEGLE